MSGKLSRNIAINIVFVSLVSILGCAGREEIKAVRGWDLIDLGQEKYAILFDAFDETREEYLAKNEDHNLPVLILFRMSSESLAFGHPPKIYTVIWEDGTIIWGVNEGNQFVVEDIENYVLGIKYFQSRIDRDKVNKLLVALAGSSVWEGSIPIAAGGVRTHLQIKSGGREYSMRTDHINVFWDSLWYGSVKAPWEWERITRNIFGMIPKEGRHVSISFKEYVYEAPYCGFCWLGIVE